MRLASSTTNAQVLDNMMHRLGNRTSAELRARVAFELNNGIDRLESGPTLPWFLEATNTFSTEEGVRRYALPSNFIREMERGRIVVSQNGAILGESIKVDYDDLALESGQPVEYALLGDWIYFGGVPNGVYDCEWNYFAESGEFTDNSQPVTNSWLINAYDLTTLLTLRAVSEFQIQDIEMAARFNAELQDPQNRFWRLVEARQHAGRFYKIED
jgi:hypothetical protein